jgi:hypothetical protein
VREAGLGLYVFDVRGTCLGTAPSGGILPIRPEQVGSLLALTGRFARPVTSRGEISRLRFDGLEIVSVRGSKGVVAAASRASEVDAAVREARRALAVLERRWPGWPVETTARVAKRLPRVTARPTRPHVGAASILAGVVGIFSRSSR